MDKSSVPRNTTNDTCGKAQPSLQVTKKTTTTKTTTKNTTTKKTKTKKTTTKKRCKKKWIVEPYNMDEYGLSPFLICKDCRKHLFPCIVHVDVDELGDYFCGDCEHGVNAVYCCFNRYCSRRNKVNYQDDV